MVTDCVWCAGVGLCTFIMCESFKYSVCGCGCVCVVCCGFVIFGLWCPSMRRGDVVGDHGGGSWVLVVFGGVGVRWGLVEFRIIGERENDICGWFGVCDWGDCGGAGGVSRLSSVLVSFSCARGDMGSLWKSVCRQKSSP